MESEAAQSPQNKENEDVGNPVNEENALKDEKPSVSVPSAPSPNALRKRRREEIARKVESRKNLISTASSSRLDMSKVHSILSGPRLSWDWQGGTGGGSKQEVDEEDDSCGLIVDFHQDSRSALRTHINKAMSQMASRDISSQSVVAKGSSSSEELKQIIESKRRLMGSTQQTMVAEKASSNFSTIIEPQDPVISMWQETQQAPPATQVYTREPTQEKVESTQVYIRDAPEADEEEIILEDIIEPTQIYIAPESTVQSDIKPKVILSRTSSIPPNTVKSDEPEEEEDEKSENTSSSEEEVVEKPKKRISGGSVSFEEWLAERNERRKKKQTKEKIRNQSKEAKAFFEAEAEESEDEELGGIMRRNSTRDDDDGSSSSSGDEDDEDSDLEDLVASARDEFDLLKRSGKDNSKLAKLHAKWLDQKDQELEKAIEDKEFWNRKGMRGLKLLEETSAENGSLNRMQRKLKAKRDAYIEKFDSEGNLLAPEYVAEESSDYDSMEIDSDDFFDENSDDDENEPLNEEEVAIRKHRKERDVERRKRDREMKIEMRRRRQILKQKLREEKIMKEKDKRELQAGLGIMNEEDRETFKLVSRTQGVFGYSQAPSGITTQSTSATASIQSTPVFSFLGNAGKHNLISRTRKSSAASLELE